MSITITTDVFCNRCGDWTHGIVSGHPGKKEARKLAKDRGWSSAKGKDHCPKCTKELNDEFANTSKA